jgi:hypothetical protein
VELVFLHVVGSAGHVVHSDVSGAGHTGALFFMLRWDRYGFHKKCIGISYAKLVFLHPVKSVGHVVDYSAFGVTKCIPMRLGRETSTYYFSCSGGIGTDSIKSASGHVTLNMCFCIWWDLQVT